jgi:hypothetical protein
MGQTANAFIPCRLLELPACPVERLAELFPGKATAVWRRYDPYGGREQEFQADSNTRFQLSNGLYLGVSRTYDAITDRLYGVSEYDRVWEQALVSSAVVIRAEEAKWGLTRRIHYVIVQLQFD